MRSKAATNSGDYRPGSRPGLPIVQEVGLRTHGKTMPCASDAGLIWTGARIYRGTAGRHPRRSGAFGAYRGRLRRREADAMTDRAFRRRARQLKSDDPLRQQFRQSRRSVSAGENLSRSLRFLEADGDGAVVPWVFENMATIGGKGHSDTEAPRRFGERTSLITGCRG